VEEIWVTAQFPHCGRLTLHL